VGKAKPYRPGGFIVHPGVVAVVLVGVAVWLGLFFVGESTHGFVGVVVAVLLVVLGLWLGWFVFLVIVVEAIGVAIWEVDRDRRNRRRSPRVRARRAQEVKYFWLVLFAPALLAAVVLGFGFGYLAGGVSWGLYMAVATTGVVAYVEFLMWRGSRDT
jgi:4-hydroxybenzoate polyprenyltransferase